MEFRKRKSPRIPGFSCATPNYYFVTICTHDKACIFGMPKALMEESQRKVWQRSFHDHIIRNQESCEKIWLYTETNPMKWETDCFWCREEG